jgi:transcriptional regulator with XRE-family HTH domain
MVDTSTPACHKWHMPEITTVSFGESVRKRRESLQRSRDAVAHRAGIATRSLARYEADESEPSLSIAARIAEALETTLPELLAS